MAFIEERIKETLAREGTKVVVKIVLSPPWTTDWMSDITKAKLRAYGIAPPEKGGAEQLVSLKRPNPVCPNCGASDTKVQSEFGSTPCKSFLHCNSCHQPFEAFKSI
jgi:ring-1,2-phenylacetyl-CoA epoxidase subunit PaaD